MKTKPVIVEDDKKKVCLSENYNYMFDKKTGYFARWGKNKEDDPVFSPLGPEIADIEISTICSGVKGVGPCRFCYKSNTSKGDVMDLPTFEKLLSKFPKTLSQIAFGIGDIDANADMWSIFRHCREKGVIPNVTINGEGLADYHVNQLSKLCGAVAVSRYAPNEGVCYDAVDLLTKAGMDQVNIHMMLSEETFGECMQLIEDYQRDPRLAKLNAIVFLALKPKGRGKSMHPLKSLEKYKELMMAAMESGVGFGFDSCSAPLFLASIRSLLDDKVGQAMKFLSAYQTGDPDLVYKAMEQLAEPCESYLFSIYVDVHGRTYPCSFLEGMSESIDILNCENFMLDVWYSKPVKEWRKKLLDTASGEGCLVEGCRQCPAFDIY